MTEKYPEAFRNISEVSEQLSVPAHVLRFWETRFSQIKPIKRSGGRRYYRPDDIALLQQIRELLYAQGYTIKGAQQVLKSASSATKTPESASRRAEALDLLKQASMRLARLSA